MSFVSIVVPTRGDPLKLNRFMQSLRDQFLGDSLCELILVFNGEEKTLETRKNLRFVTRFKCRSLYLPRPSALEARILGAKNAESPWVIFLDDDVIFPHREWLFEAWELLRYSTNQDAYTSYYLTPQDFGLIDRHYNRLCNAWLKKSVFSSARETKCLLGGFIAVSQEFASRPLPDHKYDFGGEDVWYASQLLDAGVSIKVRPQLALFHQPEKTISSFVKTACIQGAAKARLKKDRLYPELSGKIEVSLLAHPMTWLFGIFSFYGFWQERLKAQETRARKMNQPLLSTDLPTEASGDSEER